MLKKTLLTGISLARLCYFGRNELFFSSSPSHKDSQSNLPLILDRLTENVKRTKYLEKILIDLSLQSDMSSHEDLRNFSPDKARMQINKLAPNVAVHEELTNLLKNLDDLSDMRKETSQHEDIQIIDEEIENIHLRKDQLVEEAIALLVPADVYDDVEEATLEFRAGAGGSESALFVEDASNMILGYCADMRWRTTTTSAIKDSSLNRGFRILTIKVQGSEVYKYLKCQSGVHKVIRVPETENKGRLHSSTISLVVMPSVPFDFKVNERNIRYEYMRSSGPGGQSVNKTESACRATYIPTGMSVMIQQDRSQERNRKRATEILKQRLFEIEYKKNVEEQTRSRKFQIGSMDRSEKIRTYNYPQDRITDHRTGLTLFGISQMMEGQYISKFISSYQNKVYEEKLKSFLSEFGTDKFDQ